MNYAIIKLDGTVENIVVADSIDKVAVPAGRTILLATADARIGGLHDGTDFVPMAPEAPSVPAVVSKLQLVRALRIAGLWVDVKGALKSAGTIVKEDWEYASQIDRDDVLMATFAAALGLTPETMDQVFMEAATL